MVSFSRDRYVLESVACSKAAKAAKFFLRADTGTQRATSIYQPPDCISKAKLKIRPNGGPIFPPSGEASFLFSPSPRLFPPWYRRVFRAATLEILQPSRESCRCNERVFQSYASFKRYASAGTRDCLRKVFNLVSYWKYRKNLNFSTQVRIK